MKAIYKILFGFSFEIILGGIILFLIEDIRWFLLYLLLILLLTVALQANHLRKIARVFQISNEVKLQSIIKKLNISERELKESEELISEKLTKDQKESLQQDIADIK